MAFPPSYPPSPLLSPLLKAKKLIREICTAVIINEADTLTRDAQAALRRTMEKYMSNIRIILCANSTSKLIAPIKSRCLLVRVAAPTEDEVCLPPNPSSGPWVRGILIPMVGVGRW